MFKVGDYISHPLHGAGIIEKIDARRINGQDKYYYVVRIPTGDMTVLVPVETSDSVGLRPIVDSETAFRVLDSIVDIEINESTNWNRRYRENMVRLKSGNLFEVARVIKCLISREAVKSLSTGERKMLRSAKQILISELALSTDLDPYEIESKLDAVLI